MRLEGERRGSWVGSTDRRLPRDPLGLRDEGQDLEAF